MARPAALRLRRARGCRRCPPPRPRARATLEQPVGADGRAAVAASRASPRLVAVTIERAPVNSATGLGRGGQVLQ